MEQRVASEHWDLAAAAVAREGGALVRQAPETVDGWLAALPDDFVQRPELMLLAGQLWHGHGSLGEAVERCRAAAAGFEMNGAPPFMRFAARFALADAYLAVGDLAAAASLGDVLDDPAAEGDLTARAVGALAAVALALQGRLEEGRALRDRAFADPVATVIRGQSPLFEGYWVDLPAGRLDDALAQVDRGLAAFEQADPFGRMPYVLLFKGADPRGARRGRRGLGVRRTRPRAGSAGRPGGLGRNRARRSGSPACSRGAATFRGRTPNSRRSGRAGRRRPSGSSRPPAP